MYSSTNLYQYKKGKMRKVVNLYKYARKNDWPFETGLRVDGNRIVVRQTKNTKGVGYVTFKYAYTYENGKLKIESKIAKVVNIAGDDWDYSEYYGTLADDRTLYTSPAGSLVDITHVYLSSEYTRVRIKDKYGKTAWIKCPNSYDYLVIDEAVCLP